ncbi:hypothetical protein Hanom_Chr06g00514911 [Helianthus anomalus]
MGTVNSKCMRSFMNLYFSPFLLYKGTQRMPDLNSETGRQVWPPNSCFFVVSLSLTSILNKANSGTLIGNSNTSSHIGHQSSSMDLVLYILGVLSSSYPAIPTYKYKLSTTDSFSFFKHPLKLNSF